VSCALIAVGCVGLEPSGEDDGDVGESSEAILLENGTSLNGTSLNGTSLNGTSLNGTSLNGTSLNGTSLNGTSLNVTSVTGKLLKGTDFIGATLPGTLSNGGVALLRIDDIVPSSDPEILLYKVSFKDGKAWKSICGYDKAGAPIRAVPMQGRWDLSAGTATGGDWIDEPGTMSFACMASAATKCLLLGYKPWQTVQECKSGGQCQKVSLRPVHQACTRMIRADYCGDGTSHTINAVPINLWDAFALQTQSQVSSNWKSGAEWTPNGAACIDTFRYDPDKQTSTYVSERCPERESTSFACFSGTSSFFSTVGFDASLDARSLVREEFDQLYVRTY
jgi:hypothetical protein